ncbi:MAG: hypothetical protein LAT64_13395 [Phycisphaerales bacterium]|nr:hypothetical protein [Planctomycetota bacterium]MCH8509750.1 hypothetical protein [Phycisphaerales bacterium]
MRGIGTVLLVIGIVGLVLGTGPLVLVGILNPKSTAVGPGLLMVVTFPPSALSTGLGVMLRKMAKNRAAKERDIWTIEPVRHDRHDRAA